ncbi:MAG: GTP-binding protein [Candidatus Thorarchaeota archaeon]
MTRQQRIDELLELMKNPNQIRNVGIIAHIDHGKTTLTDSLLANAGMLSYNLVGQARALDFLVEEQRRGNVIAVFR